MKDYFYDNNFKFYSQTPNGEVFTPITAGTLVHRVRVYIQSFGSGFGVSKKDMAFVSTTSFIAFFSRTSAVGFTKKQRQK